VVLLRIYLLAGLITHKVVWELLKRSSSQRKAGERVEETPTLTLIKAVKVAVLLGIMAQTLLPDVLPIVSQPLVVRFVGAAVYTAGLLVAIASRIHLGGNWSDIEAGQVLLSQGVVSKGPYSYVRHPIYVGDLLLLLGLELSLNSWLVLGVVLLTPVVMRQAVREEKMLAERLPGYAVYCTQTKRFIPFVV
jgi:protein-S-isoprenylcysteine O-methyltransferase Ste14